MTPYLYYTHKGTSMEYCVFYNKDKKAYAYYKYKSKASYRAMYEVKLMLKGRIRILEVDAIKKVDYNNFYNKTTE